MATTFATPLNNVSTRLGSAYTAGSGTLALVTGGGASFPALSGSNFYRVTVVRAGVAYSPVVTSSDYTIFKATVVTGDNLTITGTLDGTSDRNYAAGDIVEVRVTKDSLGDVHTAVNNLETTSAVDSLVVHLAGTESITGSKTFSATSVFKAEVDFQTSGGVANSKIEAGTGNFVTARSGGGHLFLGTNSGVAVTSSTQNTGLGSYTLQSCTTGDNNVAIGTASLANNVIGNNSVAVGSFVASNATGSSNIGIGTASLYTLTSGIGNSVVGTSGCASLTTGSYNTALGYSAGYTNVTGSYNTYIGNQADANNTAWSNSTAIGYGATVTASHQIVIGTASEIVVIPGSSLHLSGTIVSNADPLVITNSGGARFFDIGTSDNLFIGAFGGIALTSGSNNTGFGQGSLQHVTSGYANAGIGSYTLYAVTTGHSNSAFGSGALFSVTTGTSNLCIGTNAGFNLTDGSSNVGIGASAIQNMTTGCNYNIGIGYQSLFNSTSASSNVAIGVNAGITNVTGSSNTFIGNNADASSTAWSNSTAIGYNSQVTASHQIVIGTASETVQVPGPVAVSNNFIVSGGYIGVGIFPLYPFHLKNSSTNDVQAAFGGNTSYLYLGGNWLNGQPSIGTNDANPVNIAVNNQIFASFNTNNTVTLMPGLVNHGSYSYTNWNGTGNQIPVALTSQINNGGSSPAAGFPAVVLGREGVGGQSYANFAELNIRRWQNSGVAARTALDIALTHGNGDAAGTLAATFQSDGSFIAAGDVTSSGGSIVVKTGSGAPGTSPADGAMYLDTTNTKLYVRTAGAWKSVLLT